MTATWIISDTHFGHGNILNFKRQDGSPVRDFSSLEEMHEVMVERWNERVKDGDLVYHLGDVAIPKHGLDVLRRLRGRKRLVRGNHDPYKDHLYREHFERIYGVRVLKGAVMSHVPLHPASVERWGFCIHGHTHEKVVRLPDSRPDPRYYCVCVEQTGYAPVSMDEVREELLKRGLSRKQTLGFA